MSRQAEWTASSAAANALSHYICDVPHYGTQPKPVHKGDLLQYPAVLQKVPFVCPAATAFFQLTPRGRQRVELSLHSLTAPKALA
jgi:hypothetical protein